MIRSALILMFIFLALSACAGEKDAFSCAPLLPDYLEAHQ